MTKTAAILFVFLAMLLMVLLPAQGNTTSAPSEADIAAAVAADLQDAQQQARAEFAALARAARTTPKGQP